MSTIHEGKVVTMRSNIRWCSDGFEFTCWNGEVIRGAFIIDAHDHLLAGGRERRHERSDTRDMMLEAVEKRFARHASSSQLKLQPPECPLKRGQHQASVPKKIVEAIVGTC